MSAITKTCGQCREPLTLERFAKDKSRRDGYQTWCKLCRAAHFKTRCAQATAYTQKRRRSDPNYKLASDLRARLGMAVGQGTRGGSAVADLGCTLDFLRAYLEERFTAHPVTGEMMTWANRGRTGWHIDHICPLSAFDLTDPAQLKEACHYTNLQPLWAEQNLSKGARS